MQPLHPQLLQWCAPVKDNRCIRTNQARPVLRCFAPSQTETRLSSSVSVLVPVNHLATQEYLAVLGHRFSGTQASP